MFNLSWWRFNFSQTFEEHLIRIEACFERLQKHDLKLKPSKCEFFSNSVSYLGYVVSSEGIHTNPEKVDPFDYLASTTQRHSWGSGFDPG